MWKLISCREWPTLGGQVEASILILTFSLVNNWYYFKGFKHTACATKLLNEIWVFGTEEYGSNYIQSVISVYSVR